MNITEIAEIMLSAKAVHFVGIGGISMSSLAGITMKNGYSVTGSDRTPSNLTARLENEGAKIFYSHDEKNTDGASLVVYTAAVHSDNPELSGAISRGIPLCSRAEYLGWLMSGYKERIGVAGTHGKSTVTSMLAEIFMEESNPTVVSGAELADMNGAYRIGGREHFIFESCEYCDSFLSFCPTLSVITNIEYDHADYFKTMQQLRKSFLDYVSLGNACVINADDRESANLSKRYSGKVITYGIDNKAQITAEDIEYIGGCGSFTLVKEGEALGKITLSVSGIHNVLNALAASAASLESGISFGAIASGLAKFKGAARRFEKLGELPCGALVYDDYAHHPTELRAVLSAARSMNRRIISVFQPHTFSRTASLFDDFASSFKDSDITLFADIYAAREKNESGVKSEMLAEAVEGGIYLGTKEKIASYIKEISMPNDLILILGAGDIIGLGKMLLE